MGKFIVILLAAFMGMLLISAIFPPLATASIAVGSNTLSWYWIGLTGLAFFFYRVTD